jgi:hypothetical protein
MGTTTMGVDVTASTGARTVTLGTEVAATVGSEAWAVTGAGVCCSTKPGRAVIDGTLPKLQAITRIQVKARIIFRIALPLFCVIADNNAACKVTHPESVTIFCR